MSKFIRNVLTVVTVALAVPLMYQDAQAKDPSTGTAETQAQSATPDINFTVSMPKPWTHLLPSFVAPGVIACPLAWGRAVKMEGA